MEGFRFVLAIVLSIAVVILVNILFPPAPPPERPAPDTVVVDTLDPLGPTAPAARAAGPAAGLPPLGRTEPLVTAAEPGRRGHGLGRDRRRPLRHRHARRRRRLRRAPGVRVLHATRPVQLVEEGMAPSWTSPCASATASPPWTGWFQPSRSRPATPPASLDRPPSASPEPSTAPIVLEYGFVPDDYLVHLQGPSGPRRRRCHPPPRPRARLAVNEADARPRTCGPVLRGLLPTHRHRERPHHQPRQATASRKGPWPGPPSGTSTSSRPPCIPREATRRSVALIATGGLEGAESVQVTLPWTGPPPSSFGFSSGPRSTSRLAALGDRMEEVNPYGWRIFRPSSAPWPSW
jgi:hypothetical protein